MEQKKLTNQKETLAFLSQTYPKCFFLEGTVKPLKIGIFQDLAKDLAESEIVSNRLLRVSLRHYTSSWRYLSSVKTGTPRINLQGEDGEAVEQQHSEHAAEQLKESKAKAALVREAKAREKSIATGDTKEEIKPTKHKGYRGKPIKNEAQGVAKGSQKAPVKGTRTPSSRHSTGSKAENKLKVEVPLADNELSIGNNALVKLGKEPMPVIITDIAKDGITVQLKSGMTVKVQQAQLYSATGA